MQNDDDNIGGWKGSTSGKSSSLSQALLHITGRAQFLDRASPPAELAEELALEIADLSDFVEPGDMVVAEAVSRAIHDLADVRLGRPEALIMAVWVSVALHGLLRYARDGSQAGEAWPGAFGAVLDVEVLKSAGREGLLPMSVREAEDYLGAAFRAAVKSN